MDDLYSGVRKSMPKSEWPKHIKVGDEIDRNLKIIEYLLYFNVGLLLFAILSRIL